MSIRRPITCIALCAATFASFNTRTAQAGPLIDWLFGHHRAASPAYPVGPPVPVGTTANMPVTPAIGYGVAMPVTTAPVVAAPATAVQLGYPAPGYAAGYAPSTYATTTYPATGYGANYGNYYGTRMPVVGPSGYGYPAMQPNGITAATAPTIMSYVPDYRTTQYRAPVTYYRPLMTTDPNTGAQVVALAPCTSYEYQTQRVPTFGYNGVLGSFSTPPALPTPPSMPTYTLPSGGVPVAGATPAVLPPSSNSYAMGYGGYSSPAPSYSVPGSPSYSSNYGAYMPQQSVLPAQPGLTAPPMSNYPTQPIGGTPGYYGSVSGGSTGGCTGSYAAPTYTPGLSAPQGPTTIVPTTPLPSTQYQTPYPSTPTYQPTTPSFPVTPAPGLSDPSGDVQPVLPPNLGASNQQRSQLRAIVRQPMTPNSSLNSNAPNNNALNSSQQANNSASNPLDSARTNQQVQQPTATERNSNSPALEPIPVPANMPQPRWNPGLLKAEDRTALRPVAPNNADQNYAGQGKTIQWASFHGEAAGTDNSVVPAAGLQPLPSKTSSNAPSNNQLDFSSQSDRAQPAQPAAPTSGLRAIAPTAQPTQPTAVQPTQPQPTQRKPDPRPARQTGGWNVVK